jgi:hypothetical protein
MSTKEALMKTLIGIDKLKQNKNNPRFIKDLKFKKLVDSIRQSPTFMILNPIKVDEKMVILGGNMRHRACKHLGWKDVPYEVFTKEMAEINNEERKKIGLPKETYAKQCAELVVKDNIGYGEWDYDILTSHYDALELDKMGMDLDPNMFKVEVDKEAYEESIDTKFNDYTLYFGNEKEMDIWYAFLKKLKNRFEGYDNVSERVLKYIASVYEDNKMKESKLILKFIEGDIDG